MTLTRSVDLWPCRYLPCCLLVLAFAGVANADPKPLSKEDQAKVDKAIEKGVTYLKLKQTEEGDWPNMLTIWKDRYPAGQGLLAAYALLEAGVSAKDPVVEKAAINLRPKILKCEQTYELGLGLLFFDRLGNVNDKQLIQTLALRLVAGQHRTGGWNYRCPTLRNTDETILIKLLEVLAKNLKSDGNINAKVINSLHVPRQLKALTVFQDPQKSNWTEPPSTEFSRHGQLFVGKSDNSNTQLAMLGLWAAQRHGIPVEPTFRLMVKRFEKTQRKDGCWPYDLRFQLRAAQLPNSMTCVGLMGLAIGRGFMPTLSKTTPIEVEDDRALHGLAALYQQIGVPTGQMDKPILFPRMGYPLYFLWSVERVAMLYNLPALSDKEWYRWGAEMLITNQMADGEWQECGPIVGTSFALLFLKRSHPMKDLTPKLPFTAKELNEGIARLRPNDRRLEGSTTTPSRNTKPDR